MKVNRRVVLGLLIAFCVSLAVWAFVQIRGTRVLDRVNAPSERYQPDPAKQGPPLDMKVEIIDTVTPR